jgi:D-alanyl-D-alanine carboxypeptidase
MTILGRHLLYDFPQYYNLFSRTSTHAGIKSVANTNRRLLAAYKGADGIKTGYTRAAGFNLVASAQRGNERVIATVFGGKSSTSRNARVAELLDLGFRRSPSRAPLRKPERPQYVGESGGGAGKTVRVSGAVEKSLRPVARATGTAPVLVAEATPAPETGAANEDLQASIEAAVAKAQPAFAAQEADAEPSAEPASTAGTEIATASEIAPKSAIRPAARPTGLVLASAEEPLQKAPEPKLEPEREIVTRLSTSGGRHWGINVGRYSSHYQAEKVLLRTALSEMATLEGSLRRVSQSPRGFDANFLGLSREQADLACRRLRARNVSCFMIGPS